MCQRRVANRFGRCFHRRKEKFDLDNLKPGDHIAEESCYGLKMTFWHHAIVESVDLKSKKINVIHYNHDLNPILKWPSVCWNSLEFTPDRFYRVVYKEKECYPASVVLNKARARVGEKRYCPFSNNCEHFANVCKTGDEKCHQISTGIEILGKSAILNTQSIARDAKKLGQMIIERLSSVIRQPGIAEIAEEGAKVSTVLAVFIAAVIETVLLCQDCMEAKKRLDEGRLTREEYCEIVVKRVCAALLSIFGCSAGFVLGAMIPIPLFGCFTSFLGGAVGDFLGKLAGGKLGELLTPLFIEYFQSKEKRS